MSSFNQFLAAHFGVLWNARLAFQAHGQWARWWRYYKEWRKIWRLKPQKRQSLWRSTTVGARTAAVGIPHSPVTFTPCELRGFHKLMVIQHEAFLEVVHLRLATTLLCMAWFGPGEWRGKRKGLVTPVLVCVFLHGTIFGSFVCVVCPEGHFGSHLTHRGASLKCYLTSIWE